MSQGQEPLPKPQNLPSISREDVKKQYSNKPVIVLDGYLIDVGIFAAEHPGGEGLLRAGYGGRDLSEGFRNLNHHTGHARGLVEDMRIARIVGD